MGTVVLARNNRLRDLLISLTVAAIVLGSVILVGLQFGGTALVGPGALRSGTTAPDLTLSMSTGESVTLADLRGKPVWLTFWATWCPPCRTEMPDLQEAYQTSAPGRYHYIAVNFGEDATTVIKFAREIGYTLPVAMDPFAESAVVYQVLNLPTHYFIDAKGTIREVYSGAMTKSQVETRVAELW